MTNAATTDRQIETLVDKVKQSQSLSDELNAIPYQDRLTLARAVETKINQGIRNGEDLPNLLISTDRDSRGNEHPADAKYKTATGTVDVYDLPGTIDKQALKEEFKLDLDATASQHLKTGGKEILYPAPGK